MRLTWRALGRCAYCLIHEDDTQFGCHCDHVISEKHGGETTAANLALACAFCNLHKGSDIASLTRNHELSRLSNPRVDSWNEHFQLVGSFIAPLSDIGEVTVQLLQINHLDRLAERNLLLTLRRYSILE